jgi:hypothetical protein
MLRVARTFLCVSIDCECDKGPRWKTQRPMAFDGVTDGIAKRLQPLFRKFHAKPTYLLSPEVIRDERSAEALAKLDGDHELGAHLHGEYAEPGAFEPDETTAFQRDYPPDVERAKLAYLTALFEDTFGRAPRSFRAGRFGIGASSIGILEELGYDVESSVTPHMDWSDKAPGLSFVGAPTYHPDPKRPALRGKSRVLEVPVTIRARAAQKIPIVGKRVEPRWLRPTKTRGDALAKIAKEEIASARGDRPVVLNAMFHNVEIIPNASPYASTEAAARRILDNLAGLLAFAEREGIKTIGLADVPELFSQAH